MPELGWRELPCAEWRCRDLDFADFQRLAGALSLRGTTAGGESGRVVKDWTRLRARRLRLGRPAKYNCLHNPSTADPTDEPQA